MGTVDKPDRWKDQVRTHYFQGPSQPAIMVSVRLQAGHEKSPERS